MIRSFYFSGDGQVSLDLDPSRFAEALKDPKGLLWVDFQAEPNEISEPILLNTFGFHPLAVDDALQETHVPKLDDWEDYLYIALQAVVFDHTGGVHFDILELDSFLGSRYLVTHHDQPIAALDRVLNFVVKTGKQLQYGVDHLLYRIADELVVDYMQALDDLNVEIEQLEDHIFQGPNPAILDQIFQLKRAILRLRRTISPEREVLNKLARDDYDVVDAKDRIYFRDVYDHMVRLTDITESLRDLIGGMIDTYLSVINNRMNDIMKTLTVITTLFMPISFIASFFGMNFFQPVLPLNFATGWVSFGITMSLMVLIPVMMLMWMRRKGWFSDSNVSGKS
jgi:magnesium transporter